MRPFWIYRCFWQIAQLCINAVFTHIFFTKLFIGAIGRKRFKKSSSISTPKTIYIITLYHDLPTWCATIVQLTNITTIASYIDLSASISLLTDHLLLLQLFQGNSERYFVVVHRLRPAIRARYARIHPKSWYGYIAMRIELYGCRLGMLHHHIRRIMGNN